MLCVSQVSERGKQQVTIATAVTSNTVTASESTVTLADSVATTSTAPSQASIQTTAEHGPIVVQPSASGDGATSTKAGVDLAGIAATSTAQIPLLAIPQLSSSLGSSIPMLQAAGVPTSAGSIPLVIQAMGAAGNGGNPVTFISYSLPANAGMLPNGTEIVPAIPLDDSNCGETKSVITVAPTSSATSETGDSGEQADGCVSSDDGQGQSSNSDLRMGINVKYEVGQERRFVV